MKLGNRYLSIVRLFLLCRFDVDQYKVGFIPYYNLLYRPLYYVDIMFQFFPFINHFSPAFFRCKLFMDRDWILTTDNNEANDEFGPTFNSFLNASESNLFRTFSNAVDDGIGCDSKNDNNESIEKYSGSLVDTGNRTSASENDVTSISYAENEVIENGVDSSVAEKKPTGEW